MTCFGPSVAAMTTTNRIQLASVRVITEDLPRLLTTPHPQREVGVLRIGEAADPFELDDAIGCVAGREVEHSHASDGGELMAVADQSHASAGGVGELEERPGGVLVEHPRLVDDHYGTAVEPWRIGRRCHPSPATVLVPAVAVLVQEPRHGVRGSADLAGGDLGGLPGRRDDQHPPTARLDLRPRRGKPPRLYSARGAW